jgi:hypothetical protein
MTHWLRRILDRTSKWVPRLNAEQRVEVYKAIRRAARPDADYFVMIGLAAAIAAFGLLLNSPAVIIGAMLVTPLLLRYVFPVRSPPARPIDLPQPSRSVNMPKLIVAILTDLQVCHEMIHLWEELVGDFEAPPTGVIFVVPVLQVRGLHRHS